MTRDKLAQGYKTFTHAFPLQRPPPEYSAKKAKYASAMDKCDDTLAKIVFLTGEKKFAELFEAEYKKGWMPIFRIDHDQEESESRSAIACGFFVILIDVIGIHHRMSNCCNKEQPLVQLKAALREVCGGYVAKRSLRGGFEQWLLKVINELAQHEQQLVDVEREAGGGVTTLQAFLLGTPLLGSILD